MPLLENKLISVATFEFPTPSTQTPFLLALQTPRVDKTTIKKTNET